jgi:hypothetical protein
LPDYEQPEFVDHGPAGRCDNTPYVDRGRWSGPNSAIGTAESDDEPPSSTYRDRRGGDGLTESGRSAATTLINLLRGIEQRLEKIKNTMATQAQLAAVEATLTSDFASLSTGVQIIISDLVAAQAGGGTVPQSSIDGLTALDTGIKALAASVSAATGGSSSSPAPGPAASVLITPSTATLVPGELQAFVGSVVDSVGLSVVPQPTLSWSVSAGAVSTVDQSGNLTAGATAESVTVSATDGALVGSASVSVS